MELANSGTVVTALLRGASGASGDNGDNGETVVTVVAWSVVWR